jgi:uncharacterized RDD family membrane protein YckC
MSSPGASSRIVYGGFWIRVAAALIDTVCVMAVILPLLVWIYGTGYLMDPIRQALGVLSMDPASLDPGALDDAESDSFFNFAGPADVLLNYVFPAIAVVLFWIARQATPGKMLLKLRVVDAKTLGPLTPGQAIGRYLGYYVSILGLMLGFIWVGFDPRKQGWHDKLAGTLVIRGK